MVFVLRSKDDVVVYDKNNDNNTRATTKHIQKWFEFRFSGWSGVIKNTFKKDNWI